MKCIFTLFALITFSLVQAQLIHVTNLPSGASNVDNFISVGDDYYYYISYNGTWKGNNKSVPEKFNGLKIYSSFGKFYAYNQSDRLLIDVTDNKHDTLSRTLQNLIFFKQKFYQVEFDSFSRVYPNPAKWYTGNVRSISSNSDKFFLQSKDSIYSFTDASNSLSFVTKIDSADLLLQASINDDLLFSSRNTKILDYKISSNKLLGCNLNSFKYPRYFYRSNSYVVFKNDVYPAVYPIEYMIFNGNISDTVRHSLYGEYCEINKKLFFIARYKPSELYQFSGNKMIKICSYPDGDCVSQYYNSQTGVLYYLIKTPENIDLYKIDDKMSQPVKINNTSANGISTIKLVGIHQKCAYIQASNEVYSNALFSMSIPMEYPLRIQNQDYSIKQVSLFPNPANIYIQLKSSDSNPFNVLIFNLQGKLMMIKTNILSGSIINVENLKKGTYLVRIADMKNNNRYDGKLILK